MCDSSVETVMVEEKLHGGKTMWYMGEGEQNETDKQVYPVVSACGVQNTDHFHTLLPC